jgi:prolyl oligopeptidase
VFDDAIACAEWLAGDGGWTSPDHLGVEGRSNGGLLVGALMTQRPDLFAAAVPEVGVLDMLRFHLFTIGWAWTSDYGCADDPEQFGWLHAYSPLHNLREGVAYPPTLVTTGDHDDRVVPSHSFKFTAALQHVSDGDAPALIRIDTSAGHGVGKPISKLVDERTDVLAFHAHHLGLDVT